MTHVMFDIETLDTAPTAIVMSVGAVCFDPVTGMVLGDDFHKVINVGAQKGTVSQSTLNFWLGAGSDARNALLSKRSEEPSDVVRAFEVWLNGCDPQAVWAHGAAFDFPIWEHLCRSVGRQAPWSYRKLRDTRTLSEAIEWAGKEVPMPVQAQISHSALSDSMAQARWVTKCYKVLSA